MADAATEARLLGERIAEEEARIAVLKALKAEYEAGEKLTGEGTKDEARIMKEEAAKAAAPETATREPKAERAVKPKAKKRTKE